MEKLSKVSEKTLLPLNLIYDYPVHWSLFKVLRDFVQNFYDAVGWRSWSRRFTYTYSGGTLYMEAKDVSFSYEWLVPIGASTKRGDNADYAGYFGEGFKIASLCGVRDYGLDIEAESSDWHIRVTDSTLTIDGRQLKSLA